MIAHVTNSALTPGWHNLTGLALLALVPGVLALSLYYLALRRTAACRATFTELAFPASAAIVGAAFLSSHLAASQWLGLILAAAITALGWRERRSGPTVRVVPARAGWHSATESNRPPAVVSQ